MYNQKYITLDGSYKRFRLTPEGEQTFRERYPTMPTERLAKEFGCSPFTLMRWAKERGVGKDEAYKARMLRATMHNARTCLAAAEAADPERYKALYRLRGKRACRQRRADELRIMSGEEPRYHFYYPPGHSKECNSMRKYLTRRGYIPYARYRSLRWYFAPETQRSPRLEARAKALGFQFACFR